MQLLNESSICHSGLRAGIYKDYSQFGINFYRFRVKPGMTPPFETAVWEILVAEIATVRSTETRNDAVEFAL